MPVYTYRCEACGVQFERHQSFTDTPLKTCPECRKKALKKVITPTKIIFKGSGFYATDHKSPSGETPSKSKKESKHDHDHGHDHSHADESKPAEKKKSTKSEASEYNKREGVCLLFLIRDQASKPPEGEKLLKCYLWICRTQPHSKSACWQADLSPFANSLRTQRKWSATRPRCE